MSFSIKQVARRFYIVGDTYQHRQTLSDDKWNWDKAMRQWWTGDDAKARAMAERLNTGGAVAGSAPRPPEDLSSKPVYARVEYKGKTYYQIGRSEAKGKLWLTTLSAAINFWADASLCRVLKTYQPRRNGYGRGTREEYQTLGGLRRFIERQNDPNAVHRVQCVECGSWHNDNEDCRDCGGC